MFDKVKTLLNEKIAALQSEHRRIMDELDALEKDFQDVKLNPYGITSIDFSKRQELTVDAFKMEGAVMGLTLALEILTEQENV
jgi:hypothetical protein